MLTKNERALLKDAAMNDKLARALARVPNFDKKNVAGLWIVTGPCFIQSVNLSTGARGPRVASGYGINAVEPRQFGGVVIVGDGLRKNWAERMVEAHNKIVNAKMAARGGR